jgi:hypothetical protein
MKTILDLVLMRVKSIPPYKRKVIDLKMVLDTLYLIPGEIEKDYMMPKSDKPSTASCTCGGGSTMETQSVANPKRTAYGLLHHQESSKSDFP